MAIAPALVLPKTKVKKPASARRLTALAIGQTQIIQIAVCAECGAQYGLDQILQRCYVLLHECPKCHKKVRPRGLLGDTCPDCSSIGQDQIILKQPGVLCNGLIIQKEERVRAEQTK